MVDGQRQRFTSAILPPYLRRSPRLAGVLPVLYLHGLSSGDFREALPALLGPEAAGLPPSTITRLTKSWTAEYEASRRRDLADRDYVYLWADGIHFKHRPSPCSRAGTDLVYQPILEVMTYLRQNGYKTYIVTGGGQDFVREYAEPVYGIPPEQVVGTAADPKFVYDKSQEALLGGH